MYYPQLRLMELLRYASPLYFFLLKSTLIQTITCWNLVDDIILVQSISNCFYPRDAMRWAGLCESNVSVYLSVCLGPVCYIRYCIKTEKAMISAPSDSDSPMIWDSDRVWLVEKFARGHPERGRFVRLGWVRTGDFCDFSAYKPPYLQNGYYWTLIGNRISAFDWYQNQRPWMTLNWPWAVITRCFTLHTCHHENMNELRHILSAAKL